MADQLKLEQELRQAERRLAEAATELTRLQQQWFGHTGVSSEKIPTYRAYYSDRTALLMALLCKHAYTLFERDPIKERLLQVQVGSLGLTVKGWFCRGGTEGFVAESPDMAVLVFRGTTDMTDWRTNLRAKRLQRVLVKGRPAICIHQGFLQAYERVQEDVERLLADVRDKPIYVTGHSLGGAVATVASALIVRDEIAACYTFGSPRVGNKTFDLFVKPPHYRVVNGWDAVPLVPFTLMRYNHGGDPRYVSKHAQSVARWDRPFHRAIFVNFVALATLPFTRNLTGVKDHAIGLYADILYGIARARSWA